MRLSLVKRGLVVCVFICAIVWFGLWNIPEHEDKVEMINKLHHRINEMSKQISENRSFLDKLQAMGSKHQQKPTSTTTTTTRKTTTNPGPNLIIPIVVFAFNRPTVSQCLDLLLKYRPMTSSGEFPIVVSQDGNHVATSQVIQRYNDSGQISNYLRHPDPGESYIPTKHRTLRGYYKLSLHYKWAISQIFARHPTADSVIIVEDDLEIAPDFFSYFSSLHPILTSDPSLLCISAWNDNGKVGQIDEEGRSVLYRTDFFPGLGWMMERKTWSELEPKWPLAFWDDWIRQPKQMKDRACVRPEISRTKTFGRVGVSNGQFYDKHLKFIKLNDEPVDWSTQDLSYLKKEKYDKTFLETVYSAPKITLGELQSNARTSDKVVRLEYATPAIFKSYAKTLGIMDDLKSGVPRTAYKGVVSTVHLGRRVHLAPPEDWTGYDRTAS